MVVLYASISVLNLMRDATGSQCSEMKRGVQTQGPKKKKKKTIG